jgi:hypothetical protein
VFSKKIFCLFVNWEVQTNLSQKEFLSVHWKVQSESFSNRIFVCPLESSKRIFLKSNFCLSIGKFEANLSQIEFLFVHWKVQSESFSNRIFVCPLESSKQIFLKSNFCLSIGKFKANLSQIEFLFVHWKVQSESFSNRIFVWKVIRCFAILLEIYKFQLDCPSKQYRRNLIFQLSDPFQVLLFCG